jgi:uncharacterized cupin superfamily protein
VAPIADWFVANIRDQQWYESPGFGFYSDWEQGEHFPQIGVNIGMARPGEPGALYHRESRQEGFLVLSGEVLLIVEGEERTLRQWDYFHCPAGVGHIIVGAGDGPAVLIAVGARFGPKEVVYPVDPVALKHGAGVEQETTSAQEAYAPFPDAQPVEFREEFLPH